jgi:TolA protein
MTVPSLQKTALLSFGLHVMIFLLAVFILKQSNRMVIPSPYTVDLVSPGVMHKINKGKSEVVAGESRKSTAPPVAPEKSRKDKAEEEARETALIEKKIDKLRQRRKVKNEISDLDAKRKALAKLHDTISVEAGDKHASDSKRSPLSAAKGTIFDAYYAKIQGEIWQHWYPPDVGRKNIEAIVSVKISKDGKAVVRRMEKSSGDALFDRSVRLAIAKASPLSRPPYEMEIGVRFHP